MHKFIPDTHEEYFSVEINQITGQVDIKKSFWGHSPKDQGRYRDYNVFETKIEAERVAEKIRELLKNQ